MIGDDSPFGLALSAALKVFAMGAAGYFMVWRGLLPTAHLGTIGALIGNLTLPCLIFSNFARAFDPVAMPFWWVLALAGAALQLTQIGLGRIVSRRLRPEQGRDEMTMLLGYQNAGFFVLPMLQSLLPPDDFVRGSVMLFVFIMFFNASIWPAGTFFLLRRRELDARRIILPPTWAVLAALLLFGLGRPLVEALENTMLWHALVGDPNGLGQAPGAIELLGSLTVPLATIVLGGTVAQTAASGWSGFANKKPAIELSFWKLLVWPALGFALITLWPTPLFEDRTLRLLIMLQFSAPPAINISVFCQQFGYPMKLTPAACLLAYALCVVTVPLWVALVL